MTQSKQQEVTLVTRNSNKVIQALEFLVYAGVVWYMFRPDDLDRVTEQFDSWRSRLAHRLAVWNALDAIEELPETDER